MLRLFAAALLVIAAALPAAGGRTLIEAVQAGDRAAVRQLLRQKVDVDAPAADGSTALYAAAQRNDIDLVKLLVGAGADVNAATRYGAAPLTLACVNGSRQIVDVLLEAGADPNTASPQAETVLMTAARAGATAVVEALIAWGADVNARESTRGQTALMWAAGEGHLETMRALIAAGADVTARSTGGFTALLFASRDGQAEAVRFLLDAGADVNDAQIPPPAAGRGGRGIAAPAGGPSALILAIGSRHYELAAYLLQRGADPNAAAQGWTALHQITWVRKPGQGSNGPPPTGSGDMDSLELVRRLAAHGADLNARMTKRAPVGTNNLNMIGATAFLMAARTADAPLMRLLGELGANPHLTNEDGTTPLMAAAGVGVYSPGEDPGTEAEALGAVKVALELGNDVNAVDANGETAMHGAAYKQFPPVVQLLVESGATIDVWNTKNKHGWTPLRIAVGVHRGMNFRFSTQTAAVLTRIMKAEGVSTVVEPERVISGATR
jgi:ankyrin repeat protein